MYDRSRSRSRNQSPSPSPAEATEADLELAQQHAAVGSTAEEAEEAAEAEETVAPLDDSGLSAHHDSATTRQHRQKRKYSVSLKSHAEVADFLQQIDADEIEAADGEHTAESEVLHVTVPEGMTVGQALYVGTPDGREIVVTIPEGVAGGQEIEGQEP